MRFDQEHYERALLLSRAGILFDEIRHPRDLNGRWKEVEIPGGVKKGKLGDVLNREKKGVPNNTQDLHTVRSSDGRWHYTKERTAFHRSLVDKILADTPTGEPLPHIVFTAGGAGSGKTEGMQKLPDLTPPGAVLIDPDLIKVQLPEYRRLVEEGDPRAMALVHDESIDVAQRLLRTAIERKSHIVMDGTGASPQFLDRLDNALANDYEVKVVYFNTDTNTALQRIRERKKLTGRGVNENVARDMHRNASRLFHKVYDTGVAVEVYDTTDPSPRLIAHAEAGADLEQLDRPAMNAFLDKAKEPSAFPKPTHTPGAVNLPTGGYKPPPYQGAKGNVQVMPSKGKKLTPSQAWAEMQKQKGAA